MYLHVLSHATKAPETQAEAWQVYLSAMNRVTQHLVRLVTPTGAAHERVIFEVPEQVAHTVEERILPVLLGAAGNVQRKPFGVRMQPSWNARALIAPTILAQALDQQILSDSSACLSLHWSQMRCSGLLAFQADDTLLLERLADAGWEIKVLPPPLVPLATALWKLLPPRATTVLPLMAGAMEQERASLAGAPADAQLGAAPAASDRPGALPADDAPAPQAPDSAALTTAGDDRVIAQDQDVGVLLGVSELGAAVRLAWRAMSLGVTGPPKQVSLVIRTLIERALDWGQKDGCGILGIIPSAIADDIANETWLGRVRFLDGRDLHQSAAMPLAAITAQVRDAIFCRYGLPTGTMLPVGSELADVLYMHAPHLATPTLVGLIAPPGDDLRGVVDSNGAVFLVGEPAQETQLLADLLWALFDTPAFERTPLIVSYGALRPPAGLAERSFHVVVDPAFPTTMRLSWEGNRWELLDSTGQRVAVVEADLHARPAEAVAQESDAIHRILGAGYGTADSLVPQAAHAAAEPKTPVFATDDLHTLSANGQADARSTGNGGSGLGGLLATLYALPGSPERAISDDAADPDGDDADLVSAWDLASVPLPDDDAAEPAVVEERDDADLGTLFGMPGGDEDAGTDGDANGFPFGDAFDMLDGWTEEDPAAGVNHAPAHAMQEDLMSDGTPSGSLRPWQRKRTDTKAHQRFSPRRAVIVDPEVEIPLVPSHTPDVVTPVVAAVEEPAAVAATPAAPAEKPAERRSVVGRSRGQRNRASALRTHEEAAHVVTEILPDAAEEHPLDGLVAMPADSDAASTLEPSHSNGQRHPARMNALSSLIMPVVTVPTSVLLGDGTTSPLVVAGLATRAALESQRVGDLPGAMQCTILAEDAHRYAVLAAITIPAMQHPEERDPDVIESQPDRPVGIDADDDDDFATAGFVVTGAASWPNEEEAAPAPPRRNPSPKRRAGVKLSNGRG